MKLVFVLFATLMASTALAADSGCGLGSVIISKNSKGLQLLSMTTNGSFLSQAFGITSGTSGCSASGIVSNDQEIKYFVKHNQDDLSREMARGQGERLEALAQLHGCTSADARTAFMGMTQKSYGRILPASNVDSEEVVKQIRNEMNRDQQLAQLCKATAA
jgi:hypothetical protein